MSWMVLLWLIDVMTLRLGTIKMTLISPSAMNLSEDCIQAGANTFGPRVPQFWRNFFWCFSTWKNWEIALQNIFWSCGYISKMVWSIFMIFGRKTPLTTNKRRAKIFFQNFLPILRNNQLCKNWNFSKPRFLFFWNSKLKLPKA